MRWNHFLDHGHLDYRDSRWHWIVCVFVNSFVSMQAGFLSADPVVAYVRCRLAQVNRVSMFLLAGELAVVARWRIRGRRAARPSLPIL